MAFDIINGVAHFKFSYNNSDASAQALRNNIITNLAEYLPLWLKNNENTFLQPSWTSSGKIQFNFSSYGYYSTYGIYCVLSSYGKTDSNHTYFKDSNGKWSYSTYYGSTATPFNWTLSNDWNYC